ncbi:MAG: hypothetical protein AB7O66_07440 [Limisphaerales bacterium]
MATPHCRIPAPPADPRSVLSGEAKAKAEAKAKSKEPRRAAPKSAQIPGYGTTKYTKATKEGLLRGADGTGL